MRHAAALLCVLLLVLTGCNGGDDSSPGTTGADSSAGAATEPPKPPRRPRVGDCHRLDRDQALAPTAPTQSRVPCRRKPTAITFFVGRVGRDAQGQRLDVDSPRVQRRVAETCPEQLSEFLGGTPDQQRRSLLTAVWFTPTLAQADAGAGWFRCDVVATGAGDSLMTLPAQLSGALDDETVRERFALCAAGEPGRKSFSRVPCTAPHGWRAATTVDLSGDRYPGKEALETQMADACSDAATQAATNPLDVRWSQEGPTRKQWRAGQRHGLCWVPS